MLESSSATDTSLSINWLLDAPVERVYAAWLDPEQMTQWMSPGEVGCEKVLVDPRPGGHYEIHMQTDDGLMVAHGEYIDIVEHEKLVFSWQWRDGTFTGSVVTVRFEAAGQQTRLQLEHSALPNAEKTGYHRSGWKECIEKLATQF